MCDLRSPSGPLSGSGLTASENQAESLEAEIGILEASLSGSFQIPPRVWIEERLRDFQKTLELNTGLSALVLRKVLGRIRLEVLVPEVGHPYYVAHTKLAVVELLDPRGAKFSVSHTDSRPPAGRPAEGTNALQSWTRLQSIRTLAQIPIEIPLVNLQPLKYQEIAEEVVLLRKLGLPIYKIARSTGVADKTVLRAVEWMNEATASEPAPKGEGRILKVP